MTHSGFNNAMCGKSWCWKKTSRGDDCLLVKSNACSRLQHGHTLYTVVPWVQSKRGMNIAKQDFTVNVPRSWLCIIHVLWNFLAKTPRRSILRQLINETLHNLNIKLTLRLLHWPLPCWIAFKQEEADELFLVIHSICSLEMFIRKMPSACQSFGTASSDRQRSCCGFS